MASKIGASTGFDKPHSIIKSNNHQEKKSNKTKSSTQTRQVVVNDTASANDANALPRLPTPQNQQAERPPSVGSQEEAKSVNMQDSLNQRSEQQSMRYTDRSGLGTKYPNSLADTMTRMPQSYAQDENDDRFVDDINYLKTKVTYKPPVGSLYARDFTQHKLEGKAFKLISDPWKTYFPQNKGEFSTTSRMDYKDWKQPPPSKNFVQLWKPINAGVPFGGRSGYKSEFLNWGNHQVAIERPVQPKTVIEEAPFFAKTTTGTTYNEPIGATKVHKVNHDLFGKKSPLAPGLPFLAETTSGTAHKPFKVEFVPADQRQKPKPTTTPAYPGQFNSTYKNEFIKFDGKVKANSKKPRVGFV